MRTRWFVYKGNENEFAYFDTQEEAHKQLMAYIASKRAEAARYGEYLSDDVGEIFMGIITHEAHLVEVEPDDRPDHDTYYDLAVRNADEKDYTPEPKWVKILMVFFGEKGKGHS